MTTYSRMQLSRLALFERPIVALLAFLVIALMPITECRAISLVREIVLIADEYSTPKTFERATDGGFLIGIDAQSPTILKLDSAGKISWSFDIRDDTTKAIEFAMLGATQDNGVLVCLTRRSTSSRQEELPSLLLRLDSTGKEIGRLDPIKRAMEGGPVFYATSCAPWGTGYLLLAQEKRRPGDAGDLGDSWPYRSVVVRVDSNLSELWRKPMIVQGGLGNGNPPREFNNGDMVIPGNKAIVRLDQTGIVKARADFPICTTLRTIEGNNRLRFACYPADHQQAVVTEYDEALKVISRRQLGTENAGLPRAAELATGAIALLGTHDHYQPDIQLYSAAGKALSRYIFRQQSASNYVLAVGPSEIAVLRDSIPNEGNVRLIISWLDVQ